MNYSNLIFTGVFFYSLFRLLELGIDPGGMYNTLPLSIHDFLLWTGYLAGYSCYILFARSWIAVAVKLLVEPWQKRLSKFLVVAIYYSMVHFALVDIIVVLTWAFPENYQLYIANVRPLPVKREIKVPAVHPPMVFFPSFFPEILLLLHRCGAGVRLRRLARLWDQNPPCDSAKL